MFIINDSPLLLVNHFFLTETFEKSQDFSLSQLKSPTSWKWNLIVISCCVPSTIGKLLGCEEFFFPKNTNSISFYKAPHYSNFLALPSVEVKQLVRIFLQENVALLTELSM